MKKILLTAIISISLTTNAQDTTRNKKGGGYLFKTIANCDALEVQNQNQTGTCWSATGPGWVQRTRRRRKRETNRPKPWPRT